MSVQGVIAREVRDVRLGMRQLVTYDPRDPWMVPMPFDGEEPDGPIRVAFTKNTFEFPLHPAVERALDTAAAALRDAGYAVVETEPPLLREIATEAGKCLFGEFHALLGNDIEKHGSQTIIDIFRGYNDYFGLHEPPELLRGLSRRTYYARQWSTFLHDHPLVLTPLPAAPHLQVGPRHGRTGRHHRGARFGHLRLFHELPRPAGRHCPCRLQ